MNSPACRRSSRARRSSRRVTCFFTVGSLIPSALAISLFEQPSAGGLADSRPRSASDAPPASTPRGAVAALQKKISLSFPRDTLEHCLELLAKEIDTEVVIEGRDLQLEGITKNQSFGLDERDRMAGDILKKVLELANPDGKLIWVIKPKGQAEAIFITTRAAAAKRKDPLPAEFTPPVPRKKP